MNKLFSMFVALFATLALAYAAAAQQTFRDIERLIEKSEVLREKSFYLTVIDAKGAGALITASDGILYATDVLKIGGGDRKWRNSDGTCIAGPTPEK